MKYLYAGTLFSSMMFPDRAPSDVYLYTTFVGGSRNRELAKASRYLKLRCLFTASDYMYTFRVFMCMSFLMILFNREELKDIVTSDLRQLLGAEGEPSSLK